MCDCLRSVDEGLAEHNAILPFWPRIDLKTGKLLPVICYLVTEKVDRKKRGKPPVVYANYCPFCGQSYDDTSK